MRRRLQIGYLDSIVGVPIVVAQHFDWFAGMDWSLELSLELGWGTLLNSLNTGKLNGAIGPLYLPFMSKPKSFQEEGSIIGCSGICFGGTKIVCSQKILQCLKEKLPVKQLRFATSGWQGYDLYYIRSWLRSLNLKHLEAHLVPVQVAVSQNANFLEADLIDLYVSLDAEKRLPTSSRSSGKVLLSGHEFETRQISRILVLRRDCISLDPHLLEQLLPTIQRAVDWLEDEKNLETLNEILLGVGYYDPISSGGRNENILKGLGVRGFSYNRGSGVGNGLTTADLKLGWEMYSGSAIHDCSQRFVPSKAEEMYYLSPFEAGVASS